MLAVGINVVNVTLPLYEADGFVKSRCCLF
jgi:hypothetical protein